MPAKVTNGGNAQSYGSQTGVHFNEQTLWERSSSNPSSLKARTMSLSNEAAR